MDKNDDAPENRTTLTESAAEGSESAAGEDEVDTNTNKAGGEDKAKGSGKNKKNKRGKK